MAAAANRIVENRGGITVMDGGKILGEVALPIAGIMSDDSLVMVNSALEAAKDEAFRPGRVPGHRPLHDPELHGSAGDPVPAASPPGACSTC